MTEEVKQKLHDAGREDLIRIHEINQSGYAGCARNGNIVDRREHPEAVPVPENKLLGIPPAKEWPHSAITAKKIVKNVWIATCNVTKPIRTEVNAKGTSEKDAIDKLKKFFEE